MNKQLFLCYQVVAGRNNGRAIAQNGAFILLHWEGVWKKTLISEDQKIWVVGR